MDDFSSLWSFQEGVEELKQKLLTTTLELEQVKIEADEEMRKNKEYAKQLMQLFKIACQERDQARDQLQKILNKVMIPSTNNQTDFCSSFPQFQPESPLLMHPTKANSSITDSNNSFSETYNYGSSHGDSFFDNVSSPELSNMNMGDSGSIPFMNQPNLDHGSLVIDNIAKGKNLPAKGKFLKAVLDAGPLLQNLLVAGPLPRWRNPPQLQTFHIPIVSIKGCDAAAAAEVMSLKPAANLKRPYAQMSCASSQMISASVLNFANVPSGSCHGGSDTRLISAGVNANNYVSLDKRQRFC